MHQSLKYQESIVYLFIIPGSFKLRTVGGLRDPSLFNCKVVNTFNVVGWALTSTPRESAITKQRNFVLKQFGVLLIYATASAYCLLLLLMWRWLLLCHQVSPSYNVIVIACDHWPSAGRPSVANRRLVWKSCAQWACLCVRAVMAKTYITVSFSDYIYLFSIYS